MKILNLKKLACITAIVLAPFIAFAGGTNSTSEGKASTSQSNDPDSGMKEGDMGVVGVGQSSKQDTVMVDDATLTTNVKNALKADPTLSKLHIKTEVSDGVVTLTGVASDKRWTARATTVANSVKGVKSVNNNMTIGHK
ncbi:MAG: BON domain-containing protein [Methylotenera sp.]|nr:BON domain-containing protein [Methylotenera sp.]MDP1721391.1 BON domain-containing protein [Candidatus Nanopelagicaceae bacterium]